MEDKNRLSEAEELIMAVLVKSDEDLTLEELAQQVNLRFGKQWKIQTICTYLTRMQKKGYISIYRIGRYSHYHPEISLDKYRMMMLSRANNLLFGGNWESMSEFIGYVRGEEWEKSHELQQ